jgi:hypothetical protein
MSYEYLKSNAWTDECGSDAALIACKQGLQLLRMIYHHLQNLMMVAIIH